MSDENTPSRQLARTIKQKHNLVDTPLDQVVRQVKALRTAGATDEQIREHVPRILKLKQANDEITEEDDAFGLYVEDSDELKGIHVEELPSEYDRDDWT